MAETKKTTTATKTVAKKTTTATTAKKTTAAKKPATKKVEEVKVVEAPVEVKAEVKTAKKAGPSLKITLVKSASGRLAKQQKTLVALGLTKINAEVIKPDNAATRGMIFVVKHLVKVEEVK